MARFLLLAKPTGRSSRMKGDPIGVFEDDHVFSYGEDKALWLANGNLESEWTNTFCILDVPGVTLEEAQRMMEVYKRSAVEGDEEFDNPDDADKFVILGRHRWCFDLDTNGTVEEKQDMTDNAILSVTESKLNAYTVDRSGLDDVLVTDSPKEI